jgi:hypothetical protein
LLDIGEMKDKARSAVLSCRVATVEEAYANILSGSGRFNYYRNRSESLGRGNVVGKTATSLRSADPHLCRVSKPPPSLTHASVVIPNSAARPKNPEASEVERAPINSVDPVRLTPM